MPAINSPTGILIAGSENKAHPNWQRRAQQTGRPFPSSGNAASSKGSPRYPQDRATGHRAGHTAAHPRGCPSAEAIGECPYPKNGASAAPTVQRGTTRPAPIRRPKVRVRTRTGQQPDPSALRPDTNPTTAHARPARRDPAARQAEPADPRGAAEPDGPARSRARPAGAGRAGGTGPARRVGGSRPDQRSPAEPDGTHPAPRIGRRARKAGG